MGNELGYVKLSETRYLIKMGIARSRECTIVKKSSNFNPANGKEYEKAILPIRNQIRLPLELAGKKVRVIIEVVENEDNKDNT